MGVFIQSQFESRVLIPPRLFSDKYCMDAWEAQGICKVSNNLLYDVASSRENRKNLSYTNIPSFSNIIAKSRQRIWVS